MDRPENTADVVALLVFARPLSAAFLRRLIETRLLRHARFRERVVMTGISGGACWEPDQAFLLGRHLVVDRLDGQGPGALRELVGRVATEQLDFHHPLWRVHLVEGVGKGCALVAKIHHCVGDGFALVSLLLSLADEDTRPPEVQPRPSPPRWREAGRMAVEGVRIAETIGRMALLPEDSETQLKAKLTGRRHVAWSTGLPLEELRRASHREGATLNDLLMASLAGALRHELGEGAAVVRALVPVNLRPPGIDEEMGNRFGLVFLDLPVSLAMANARLESIRSSMAKLKSGVDAIATYGLLGALGLGPLSLERKVADFFTRKASLVVTNVPGPKERLHFGGVRVDRIMFWVPHPALLGLGVSILSYAGEIVVGVRADEAVMPHPENLVRRFVKELAPFRGNKQGVERQRQERKGVPSL